MDSILYYDEIFVSIQGESTCAGLPCLFVRLHGCDVGCAFCDQPQAGKRRRKISIENLVNAVQSRWVNYVCITGGEPLMQWNALYPVVLELVENGYKVSIETSGCYKIDEDLYNRQFNYIMDIKCPSSGVSEKNIYTNLMCLHRIDEVKFVISDRADYLFAKDVLNKYPTSAKILMSPCFDEHNHPKIGKELVEWILADKNYTFRVQTQLHKILEVM